MFPYWYKGVSDPLWFGSPLLPLRDVSGSSGWSSGHRQALCVQTDITDRRGVKIRLADGKRGRKPRANMNPCSDHAAKKKQSTPSGLIPCSLEKCLLFFRGL